MRPNGIRSMRPEVSPAVAPSGQEFVDAASNSTGCRKCTELTLNEPTDSHWEHDRTIDRFTFGLIQESFHVVTERRTSPLATPWRPRCSA